jgi:hypothetical protein
MTATGIRVVAAGVGEPPAADAAPGSVLTQLRERAARQREAKRLELPIGGEFGDRLVAVYGVLPIGELEHYTAMAGKLGDLAMATDVAISACTTLCWREHDDVTDLGVRYGPDLWQLLDWPLPEGVERVDDLLPRDVVAALFGGNGIAQLSHVEKVVTWMQDPGADAPGEASAAT